MLAVAVASARLSLRVLKVCNGSSAAMVENGGSITSIIRRQIFEEVTTYLIVAFLTFTIIAAIHFIIYNDYFQKKL